MASDLGVEAGGGGVLEEGGLQQASGSSSVHDWQHSSWPRLLLAITSFIMPDLRDKDASHVFFLFFFPSSLFILETPGSLSRRQPSDCGTRAPCYKATEAVADGGRGVLDCACQKSLSWVSPNETRWKLKLCSSMFTSLYLTHIHRIW